MREFIKILFCLIFTSSIIFSQTLVINEIHADPDATNGDANGDGVVSSDNDEFVELINNSGSPLDISGWTLSDGVGVKYTFVSSTIVPAGESVVVFGGGTPTGIPGLVFTTGTLGLNNSGDDVIIKDDLNVTIDSYNYGSEGGDNQSLGRNPDITGSFEKHSTFAPGGTLFSPGARNDDGTPLPVELSTFTAELVNNLVELNWKTATEVNNFGFDIERSYGENEFEKIGFVKGSGNSNSPKEYLFVDEDLPNADKVSYRLKQIDNDGSYNYSKVVEVDLTTITGVDEDIDYTFSLDQNYPNPFNPTTTISFTLPNTGSQNIVKLNVFNLLGQKVQTLVNEAKPAGEYKVQFDASDLPSGIYFYALNYGGYNQTKKFVLMK